MMSSDRRQDRRSGTVPALRPPGEHRFVAGWHLILTPNGEHELYWTPGVGRWSGWHKLSVTAEVALDMGWTYLHPVEPPPAVAA